MKERKSAKSSSASISYKSSEESVTSKKVSKDSKIIRELRARRESQISQLSDFQTTSSSSSCDAGEEPKTVKPKTVRREIKFDQKKSVDLSDGRDKAEEDSERHECDTADVKIKGKMKRIKGKSKESLETSSDTGEKGTEKVKRKSTTCRDAKFPDSARSDDSSPERKAVSAKVKDDEQTYSSDFVDFNDSSKEEDLEKSDKETKQGSDMERKKGATFTIKKLPSSELSENSDTDKSANELKNKLTKSAESGSSDDVDNTVIEAATETLPLVNQARTQGAKKVTVAKSSSSEGSESETRRAVKRDARWRKISDKKVVNRML